MRRFTIVLLLVSTAVLTAGSAGAEYRVDKLFEETSYQLKDVCFINATTGWAVGAPHWDQGRRRYRGTVLMTDDAGDTWSEQSVPVAETLRGVVFIDANNGWAVGVNGTIIHTSNGGTTWVRQTIATTDELRGVVFVDSLNGWATSIREVHWDWTGEADDWRGKVWHTSNGGTTWVAQSLPANAAILNRIDFADSLHGWIAGIEWLTYDPWTEHRSAVYTTSNGGQTWQVQYPPEPEIVLTGIDFLDASTGWAVGFKMNSGVSGGTVFKTVNGGASWQQLDPDYVLWDVQFLDANNGYAVGTMYGAAWGPPVIRTMDGGATWETVIMDEHQGEGLYGLAVTTSRVVAVGDDDFMGVSTDPWAPYPWPNGGDLFTQHYLSTHYLFNDVFFIDDQRGWAVGRRSYRPQQWGQLIMATEDGGQSWTVQYDLAPPVDGLFSFFEVKRVQFTDPLNGWAVGEADYFMKGCQGALLHTDDGGATWVEQGSELMESWCLEFVGLHMLDGNTGWIVPAGRFPYDNFFLARTSNGGTTWEWVDTGVPDGWAVSSGGVVFSDSLHGWATGSVGLCDIVATEDGGVTWAEQSATCGRVTAIDFVNSLTGWIVGEFLVETVDGGTTWTYEDNGISGDLEDIDMISSSEGWMVGDYGAIQHTTNGGTTWSPLTSPTAADLLGVSFPSSAGGWIAGDHGVILRAREVMFSDGFESGGTGAWGAVVQ